jgi:hypothetical protein
VPLHEAHKLRECEKRLSALLITTDERTLLVADKAGDLYRFHAHVLSHSFWFDLAASDDQEGTLIAGHVSMLFDLVNSCI